MFVLQEMLELFVIWFLVFNWIRMQLLFSWFWGLAQLVVSKCFLLNQSGVSPGYSARLGMIQWLFLYSPKDSNKSSPQQNITCNWQRNHLGPCWSSTVSNKLTADHGCSFPVAWITSWLTLNWLIAFNRLAKLLERFKRSKWKWSTFLFLWSCSSTWSH